ncbi:MAG: outer membrane protein [Hyphomicrobiaceae bacterium]
MRSRALPLAAFASLLFLPQILGTPSGALAADLGGKAPVEDAAYDFGDDDYVAPSPWYLAVRGAGGLTDNDEFQAATPAVSAGGDGMAAITGAIGIDLEQTFDLTLMRGELELTWAHHAGDTDASGIAGFVSLYRDIGEFYRFRPYVGAGAGLAHISLDGHDSTAPAFHLTAGFAMEWSKRTMLDFGYRFMSIQDVELGADDVDLDSHALYAGLRFRL